MAIVHERMSIVTLFVSMFFLTLLPHQLRAESHSIAGEDFSGFADGKSLSIVGGWSGDEEGTRPPDSKKITIAAHAMNVQNDSDTDPLALYWRPTLWFTPTRITLSYDLTVANAGLGGQRVDIGQYRANEGYIARFLQTGPNTTGVYLQYRDNNDWQRALLGDFKFDQPYHIELEVDVIHSTVRMRYGPRNAAPGAWSSAYSFTGSASLPVAFLFNGRSQLDNISLTGEERESLVTFPSFEMTTADVKLVGVPKGQWMVFTAHNPSEKEVSAKLELRAPRGWVYRDPPGNVSLYRNSVGQKISPVGPGSWTTHQSVLTIPAGGSVTEKYNIDCPNWNPYNRYPLTCKLIVDDQTTTQVRDIVGKQSQGKFLGQPRDARDIQNSAIGTMLLPFSVSQNPACIPLIAKAGIKWVRTAAPLYAQDSILDPQTHELLPTFTKIPDQTRDYIQTMHKYGLKMIWVTGPTGATTQYMNNHPEAVKAYCKRAAELLAPLGVDHFEIDNEPTSAAVAMWGGTWNGIPPSPWVPKLAAMMNGAADGLKEGNPNATVIAGAGCTTTQYRLMEAGLSKSIDGITDHTYPFGTIPELIPFGGKEINARDQFVAADDDHSYHSLIRHSKEHAVAIGRPDFQFWYTEFGFSAYQSNNQTTMSAKYLQEMNFDVITMGQKAISSYEGYTERTQAKYIARRLVETLAFPSVTVNFVLGAQSDWTNPRHWEANWFLIKDDLTCRPAYYAVQRICGLFSDGVTPIEQPTHVEIGIDYKLGRSGSFWTRPYVADPIYWGGNVPLYEPTRPRHYLFKTPDNELMLAVWMPVYANEEIQPQYSDIVINTMGYEHPVAIDLLTGERHDLEWDEDNAKGVTILRDVTVPDYPVVIKMFPKDRTKTPVFTDRYQAQADATLIPIPGKHVVENLDRYRPGHTPVAADGWSADFAGNANPDPKSCTVQPDGRGGKALQLENPTDGNLRLTWKHKPAELDANIPLARLSCDIKLLQKMGPHMQRSWIETATSNTRFWFMFSNTGVDTGVVLQAFNAEQRGYNVIQLGNSFDLGTWYHVDIDMDYVNNRMRARFNKSGEADAKWSQWYSVGAQLDRNEYFVFGANDVVQIDNIRLVPLQPAPSTAPSN